jgi:hypothetical protein
LKAWYAQPGDQFEVTVDGFVIDIVRADLLIEIQIGNFASIKSKLMKLVHDNRVRLIYPIPQEKWITKQAKDSSVGVTRRKSPKRGRVEDLFWELVSFPYLLINPNFSLEVLLIREEELRRYDGKRNWRRRGWITEERRLLEVVNRRLFEEPVDLQALLPVKAEDMFTISDLAQAVGIGRRLSQRMAYCLFKARVIELIGKRGRANLYGIVAPNDAWNET